MGTPTVPVVKNLTAKAADMGVIPGLGRSHVPLRNQVCAPQLLGQGSRACMLQLLKPVC